MVHIRVESAADIDGIYAVNAAAFETDAEARLVNGLRQSGTDPFISLVAAQDGHVVGHILFTPVEIGEWRAVALGPMAVAPASQRRGIGSMLVLAGLKACAEAGEQVVCVLGHPEYYPRFGFRRMSEFGLTCEFKAPDNVLMVAELKPGAIAGRTGEVRYHSLFKTV